MTMRPINRRDVCSGLALLAGIRPQWSFAQGVDDVPLLTAGPVRSQLLGPESPPTDHWAFGSQPTVLTARQGQEFRVRFANALDEELWVHFFGVRGPSEMMTVKVAAHEAAGLEVVFTPPDAGTFWFGPLLSASKQREMGLTGLLIVEELEPQPYQDIPLVFDDWSLGDDGKIEADFANLDRAAGEGRLGNWFTVNATYKPHLTLNPEKPARLRMLNVANTRTVNVLFKGVESVLLARDGQPVWPQNMETGSLALAPGQRADMLLTFAQDPVSIALDLFEDVVEVAFLDVPSYGRKTLPLNTRLPANPVPQVDKAAVPREILLAIEGGLKGGLQSGKVGKDVLDLRAMLEQGLAWSIGGSSGIGSPLLFETQKGALLRLTIDNKTSFEQVLHVHGHVWTGWMPLAAGQIGPEFPVNWVDTLVIPAKSRTAVLLVADNPGTWAIQSLQAERCDAGLIGSFVVTDMP
jgi:FtsP/CotA-like multicopper oxidase with cupredoxin domain